MIPEPDSVTDTRGLPSWPAFVKYLAATLDLAPSALEAVEGADPRRLYDLADPLGLSPRALGQYVADFLGVPFLAGLDPEDVRNDLLPAPFCKANLIAPVAADEGPPGAVVANPFDWELLENVRPRLWPRGDPVLLVAEPEAIRAFFSYGEGGDPEEAHGAADQSAAVAGESLEVLDTDEEPKEGRGHEIVAMANELLRRAVSDRASDIHIEPKENGAVVRFRIDGDLQDVRRLRGDQAPMLIARFKVLGHLDIAEKRKPQDGALEAVVHGRTFKLRLATTSTPQGESLVIRLLEPSRVPPALTQLGMTPEQADLLHEFASRSQGLILVVGPTGSGKSTTIFSLLSQVDGSRRSIMTVEDPVEYRIGHANQQQVNTRAGVTFEALLRSAVRQDPDVLLVGEIRDLFSAKASLDFASSGHLTISTLHSSNATTAVFRLERLGVERGAMADALLGVVAQKLLKTLCDRCKRIRPILDEERALLVPFTDDPPAEVAEPVGCPACRNTGYHGRAGVYEILHFDREVSDLVRQGAGIAEIRSFVQERGDFLISDHAVRKVREQVYPVRDVHESVLVEDARYTPGGEARATRPEGGAVQAAPPPREVTVAEEPDETTERGTESTGSILVVEDDVDTRTLLTRFLENSGYEVVVAEDGVDALLELGRRSFDVVLSDINMPNLDGLKLLEVMSQKGLETPVVFLTAQTGESYEVKGLELGAADYLTKPVKKEVLRLRIGKLLERRGR